MELSINSIVEAARASPRAQEAPPPEGVYNPILAQKRADVQRLEAYKWYQENIRKSGMLRTEIIKGAAAGEDVTGLLIKACVCIGCMTGDSSFSRIVEERLKGAKL